MSARSWGRNYSSIEFKYNSQKPMLWVQRLTLTAAEKASPAVPSWRKLATPFLTARSACRAASCCCAALLAPIILSSACACLTRPGLCCPTALAAMLGMRAVGFGKLTAAPANCHLARARRRCRWWRAVSASCRALCSSEVAAARWADSRSSASLMLSAYTGQTAVVLPRTVREVHAIWGASA